ncbi:hypothetical protein [Gordonia rubripertincta]|uniref:hypothetical protein n=1 Tax=Gordonia rubripertincta TaxID=36822 RepID=UPI0015FBEB58|nr:hypothetical protein [Gordonia rubripertincta]QMU19372.1 hypothetical protein H3V45_14870 [Gordonia rubripertincta]
MPDLDLDAVEARWQPVPEPGNFVTGGAGGSSPSPSIAGNRGGGWRVVDPVPGGGGGGGGGSTATTHNRAAKDVAVLVARIRELETEVSDLDEQIVDLTKGY